MDENHVDKPTIGSFGKDEITIRHISKDDQKKVEGVVRGGMWWMRVDQEGKSLFIPHYEQLPDPVKDKEMLPYWRKPEPHEKANNYRLFNIEDFTEHQSPSIHIQHLCGYYYTPEKYQEIAERLETYGFECLRSRRGEEGKYWEIWILPFLEAAKGDLKEALETTTVRKDRLGVALDFLRRRVSFGTLDVCIQRLAMVMDD